MYTRMFLAISFIKKSKTGNNPNDYQNKDKQTMVYCIFNKVSYKNENEQTQPAHKNMMIL